MVQLPSKEIPDLFTGERFTPNVEGEIAWEHLHRYAAALDLCQGLSVVDIACGEGYGSYLLSQRVRSVVGIDIDEAAIRTASSRYQSPNLQFKSGSCTQIPLESRSADVVVSFETIEHVGSPDAFLEEVSRVLKPDGMLVISSPECSRYNAGKLERNEFHVSEMSEDELLATLRRRFRHVRHGYQSVVLGSLVSSAEPSAAGGFSIFSDANGTLSRSPCLPAAPYIIAVCSNRAEASELPSSFFDSGLAATIYSSLTGALAQRDEGVKNLQRRVAEIESRFTYSGVALTTDQINWLYSNLASAALERSQALSKLECTLATATDLSEAGRTDLEGQIKRCRDEAYFLERLSTATKEPPVKA